jgi:signal transduction histidine kinase
LTHPSARTPEWRSIVQRAFDRWVEHLDLDLLRAASSVGPWIATTVTVFILFPLIAHVRVLQGFFELRTVPILLTFAPVSVAGVTFAMWQGRSKTFGRSAWMAIFLGSVYMQFFTASLVAWTSPKASAASSSLLMFTAAYHGRVCRVTIREPFMLLGTLVATGAAMLLNPTADRIAVLTLAGATATTFELVAGTAAYRRDQARRREEQIHRALQAQILKDRERELHHVADQLVDVLGHNHDLNNALTSVNLRAQLLYAKAETVGNGELSTAVEGLRAPLAQLTHIVTRMQGKRTRAAAPAQAEIVDLSTTIEGIHANIRARFPGVRHEETLTRAVGLRVLVRGGALTVQRVVENLLINACEGDGRTGARTVTISAMRDPSGGQAQVVVEDDGPGFSEEQLRRPVEAFGTSKSHGTGLGLFTSERLVQASEGSLERRNRPEGGAVVTVRLPLVG